MIVGATNMRRGQAPATASEAMLMETLLSLLMFTAAHRRGIYQ
jgi:hypothetical protein